MSELLCVPRTLWVASSSRPSVNPGNPAVRVRGMAGVHACKMHFCSRPIILSVLGVLSEPTPRRTTRRQES